jgi:hypothetical protein
MKLKLFLNAPINFTVNKTGTDLTVTQINITGGSSINPFMMGYDALTAVQAGNYTTTCGICRLTTGANTEDKHIKSQCRLYFPTYKASAKYESMFMSRPEVSLRYTDLFAHTVYAKADVHV